MPRVGLAIVLYTEPWYHRGMPLPARLRAERRAGLKKLEPKRVYPKKRCKNCDKRFEQVVKSKVFCCDDCRWEFHANGGNAFGPLKIRLEKLVNKQVGELAARVRELEHNVKALAKFDDELNRRLRYALSGKGSPEDYLAIAVAEIRLSETQATDR